MPESPDFESIARHLHNLIAPLPRSAGEQEIVEQLRLMWNARGAADCAAVETRMMSDSSMTAETRLLDR